MKKRLLICVFTVTALTFSCTAKRAHDGPVRRVVTLTPSATELIATLGAAELLVGVDRYSVHPPRVKQLPKVGDFMHPSFEAIITFRATDLVCVIGSTHPFDVKQGVGCPKAVGGSVDAQGDVHAIRATIPGVKAVIHPVESFAPVDVVVSVETPEALKPVGAQQRVILL